MIQTICHFLTPVIATMVLIGQAGGLLAADWGTLSGRVVLDGKAPESQPIKPAKNTIAIRRIEDSLCISRSISIYFSDELFIVLNFQRRS